ncbi:MAG: 2-phospho-L-lactate transferase [Novosphingobium sp.]|nr:2-phospho-L-lactate transferase [Novosphingobium sp.]MCP5402885.1 2-phospho-L-lactate transferase [Novosphingobium sp.]
MHPRGHVLALSGGVGGAKLAAGLAAVLPAGRLTIAVNTGDDFEHLGLTVCPDIDSVVYALAGLNDTERGWGVADERWRAMDMLGKLGEAQWFNLGDRDLGMHIARSWRLRDGQSLSEVTARLTGELGIVHPVVPMSDTPVRTQVETEEGLLEFQRYFVGEQCRPVARSIRFAGTPGAVPSPGFSQALERDDLAAVVICPSNPYLSVDPIMAVDGVRDVLLSRRVPCIAVSPLVGGKALKGPLTKLIEELGKASDNASIAQHYRGLVDQLVIDECDAADAEGLRELGVSVTVTQTVMREAADREMLAREVLAAVGVETD